MTYLDNTSEDIFKWINSLKLDSKYGLYRMSKSTEATLFSTCFAVLVMNLYGLLDKISDDHRAHLSQFLINSQDERTGLFIDLASKEKGFFSEDIGNVHGKGYVTWQSTCFSISAMEALHIKPKYDFVILNKWSKNGSVHEWLDNLDWKNDVWTAGNLAMFMGTVLIYSNEKSSNNQYDNAIEEFFAWHDNNLDNGTGLWGPAQGAPVQIALYGGMHQFLLYYFSKRRIQHSKKIIDICLEMQEPDGSFAPGGFSGACEDYDVVNTLVNLYRLENYRHDEIKKCLLKAIQSNYRFKKYKEGFVWSSFERYDFKDWISKFVHFQKSTKLKYSLWNISRTVKTQLGYYDTESRHSPGWTKSPIPMSESDLFSTWLRSLIIAETYPILGSTDKSKWNSLKAPGLGWSIFQSK